jgi:hypothetical protein
MNGLQDSGEPGLAGVTVRLTDCQGDGVTQAVTDASGVFLFTGVDPGLYSLRFEAPAGFAFTVRGSVPGNGLDSDAGPAGTTACFWLGSGLTDATRDAGLHRDTGLVSHWCFDEGAGAMTRDRVGERHAVLVHGPLWTAGHEGGALSFDGVEAYVRAGSADPATNDLTIAAWVLWRGPNSGPQIIVAKRDAWSPTDMRWELSLSQAGRVVFGSADSLARFGCTLPTGTWVHVAAVLAGDSAAFYVNGAKAANGSAALGAGTRARLTIGGTGEQRERGSFNGTIDDLQIYNRALTAVEIAALCPGAAGSSPLYTAAGSGPLAASPVAAEWDDTDGDSLPDRWERAHFAEVGTAATPEADADHDGLPNLHEYVAGTDPRDPLSYPCLFIVELEGRPAVRFDAQPAAGLGYEGRTRCYRLEETADLVRGDWEPVAELPVVSATGQTVTWPADPNHLYRTRIWLE